MIHSRVSLAIAYDSHESAVVEASTFVTFAPIFYLCVITRMMSLSGQQQYSAVVVLIGVLRCIRNGSHNECMNDTNVAL